MGTNFYALRLPTRERKNKLSSLLEGTDFYQIQQEIDRTFGDFGMDGDIPTGGKIHLGKRSAGWKFLWNPNMWCVKHGHITNGSYIPEPNTFFSLYPLTKVGIWDFLKNPNIVVINEYNEKQNKENFFNDAINWTTWQGEPAWDSKTYSEWERSQGNNVDTYPCRNDLIKELISRGYEMISESCSDFYSDGLRFATTTEFS